MPAFRRMRLAAAFTLVVAWTCIAFAQEAGLKNALLHHTIVVRGYYTAPNLRFDQDGRLISSATTGFGLSDARLYVNDVEFQSDHLIIEGVKTFPIYNSESQQFQLTSTGEKVNIEIALPPSRNDSSVLNQVIEKVLLTTPELENKCIPEERAGFQELISVANDKQKKDKSAQKQDLPDVSSLPELPAYCFPTGERAYRVGRGLKPPKALSTPDPEYAPSAQHDRIQGTVILLLIVDQKGRPSTIYTVRSLGHGLDEQAVRAIEKWRFQPGTFQGNPVPAAINVQINFKLH